MALKNLFDMVKADRYTADGREELIKAQEAETEDKVYQIGEISQKTGLQKTANGWVKPKNGAASAKKQEKKGAGIPQATTETFVGKTYKDFVESATPSGYKPTKNTDNPDGSSTTVFEKEGKQIKVDFDKNGKITKVSPGEEAGSKPAAPETLAKVSHDNLDVARNEMNTTPEEDQMLDYFVTEMHEDGTGLDEIIKRQDGIYERSNGAYPKEEKTYKSLREKIMNHYGAKSESKGSNAETKPAETTTKFETEQENAKYEEGKKGWETVSKERLPDIKKKVEQKIDYYKKYDPYAMLGKRTGLNAQQKKAVEQNMVQAKENLAFYTGQLEGINKQMEASDSAPRVLTGDTRIRVRKA